MTSPRIIAGKYKNKKLLVPSTARPITDRAKRSLFDTISTEIQNSICLDLFAGSGSIGIEALSRGAKHVTFVEKDENAFQDLKKNLDQFKSDSNFDALNLTYNAFFVKTDKKDFDFIFLDPPFSDAIEVDLTKLQAIANHNTIIILRVPSVDKAKLKLPQSFEVILEKKIGINLILFMRVIN